MSTARQPSLELLLDRCIDRLLQGREWDDVQPADGEKRAELASLMNVAWLLHQLSPQAPTMSTTRLRRIWRKTSMMLKAVAKFILPSPKRAGLAQLGAA